MSLQTSMTGRPVALKTTCLTGRDDTLPHNDISPATSSSSRETPTLTAKVDDHPENQRRQPSMNDLTRKEQSTGSLISSSPPPRHMTMHMHPPRDFNIQYSNIYDLKLTLKLYNILTMHKHPPRAFYTHYHNIYSLKLLPLTSYQYNIHQKRITINVHKKFLQLQFQQLRKRICAYPNAL